MLPNDNKHVELLSSGDISSAVGYLFYHLKEYYSSLDENEVEKTLQDAEKNNVSQDFITSDINRKIEQAKLANMRVESPKSQDSGMHSRDSKIHSRESKDKILQSDVNVE